ncbi:MAG: CopG family transcriptional regulator [Caulobacteraceae bacterium]|nr:CopG family transcriptional regulator [Caulobacteraceae bacterium]
MEPRPRPADSEKITINLGYVDLGQVELLVREGFYATRTEFIRTAIRNQLDRHRGAVEASVSRQDFDLGLREFSRRDLEAVAASGRTLDIRVLGLAVIAPDVPADLASRTIASVRVLGAFQASDAVKAVLRRRLR